MKNASGIFAAVLGAALLWNNVGPDFTSPAEPGIISVTGDAAVRVVPDEVLITLGVETWHRELGVALRRNDKRVEEILATVSALGIRSKDIQTDYISVDPTHEDYYSEPRIINGYTVRKTMVVTLKDVSRFEKLLVAVTEAGTTNVQGIQFRTSELREFRDQARALATGAAREKAEAMAAELGMEIGRATSVREDHVGWWSWYGYGWWGAHGEPMWQNVVQNAGNPPPELEGSFAPGQISITARVSVSFELSG